MHSLSLRGSKTVQNMPVKHVDVICIDNSSAVLGTVWYKLSAGHCHWVGSAFDYGGYIYAWQKMTMTNCLQWE